MVCSGLNKSNGHFAKIIKLKSVESYHQECGNLSSILNMNGDKAYHSMVFAKNRIYESGSGEIKVKPLKTTAVHLFFRSLSKYPAKFVLLKLPCISVKRLLLERKVLCRLL